MHSFICVSFFPAFITFNCTRTFYLRTFCFQSYNTQDSSYLVVVSFMRHIISQMKETRPFIYMKKGRCGIEYDTEFCEFRAILTWTEWTKDRRGFLIGKMKAFRKLRLKISVVLRTRGSKYILPFSYTSVSFLELLPVVCSRITMSRCLFRTRKECSPQ
jgi:hypothetical protein